MRIASGVVDQVVYFIAVDSGDFTTRETGFSSFTVYRSRNGGAAAAMTTPTINEVDATNMPGVYELLLDEDMTIDAGDETQEMCFHITHAGMAPVTRTIELYRPKITAGNTLGVESDGDLTKVNTLNGHTAQTGDSFARLGAPAGASVSADIAAVDTDVNTLLTRITSTLFSGITSLAEWIGLLAGKQTGDATALTEIKATGAGSGTYDPTTDSNEALRDHVGDGTNLTESGGTGDQLTALATASALSTVDTNVSAILADTGTDGVLLASTATSAQLVDDVWDEAQADHQGDGSFGLAASVLDSGTATAGAAGSITLDAGNVFTANDEPNDAYIEIVSGTGVGQSRQITDYDNGTRVASVQPDWDTNPASGSKYVIRGNRRVLLQATNTDAIGSGSLATSAINEIRDGILDDATRFSGADIAAIQSLLDDARGEPGSGAPPVNPDAMTKLDYLYKWTRNAKDNDGTTTTFYADDGTTAHHTQSTSESGGTVTKGEIGGP